MKAKNTPHTCTSFDKLAQLVQQAGIHLKSEKQSSNFQPASRLQTRNLPTNMAEIAEPADDHQLFMRAMQDVTPVTWRHYPVPHYPNTPILRPNSQPQERILMEQAVSKNSPMSVPDHPEYIEGWTSVLGRRYLPKLRNGLYSIQGQIDLHGLSRSEARIAVEDYIKYMSRYGPCCIKIIHGRGINSPSHKATLKESLQRIFSTRKMSRYVVAYASAAAYDGGVGAVYVLLKG